jgi:hypothetical protein
VLRVRREILYMFHPQHTYTTAVLGALYLHKGSHVHLATKL